MRIKYTVTIETSTCPHCGAVLKRKRRGDFTPILMCLWFVTLPFYLSFYLLWRFGFSCPCKPKIGPKFIICPKCDSAVKTDNLQLSELNDYDRLVYKFTIWFYISYLLGTILIFDVLYILIDQISVVSLAGLIGLICALVILTTIVVYRLKEANCNSIKIDPEYLNKPYLSDEDIKRLSWLFDEDPSDSLNDSKNDILK